MEKSKSYLKQIVLAFAFMLQPSQIAGRALSTLCGKTKQASLEGPFEWDG